MDLPIHLYTYDLNSYKKLNMHDQNMIFFIGGAILTKLYEKRLCDICKSFLENNSLLNEELNFNFYVKQLDKGGLKYPNAFVFKLILNCETVYKKYFNFILHNNSTAIIDKICNDIIQISFPACCNIKKFIVNYFFTIRSFAVVNVSCTAKRKKNMYGTATSKKKKV